MSEAAVIPQPHYYEPLQIPTVKNPYEDGGSDFNPDWLPAPYNEFAAWTAKSIQINISAVGAAFLGAISIAVNGRLLVTDEKYIPDVKPQFCEAGQLWFMVALLTGERKSGCFNWFIDPIHDWVDEQNKSRAKTRRSLETQLKSVKERLNAAEGKKKRLNDDGNGLRKVELNDDSGSCEIRRDEGSHGHKVSYLDAEIGELHDKLDELEEQLRRNHLITLTLQDTTPEAAVQALIDNNGRASFADSEGGVFATLAGRYNQGVANFDTFLHGFDNERIVVHRKTSGNAVISRASMSAVYFVQPIVADTIFNNQEMIEKGFAGRFIFIKPPIMSGMRDVLQSVRVPRRLVDAYADKIRKLLELQLEESDSKITVYMDDEARKKCREFAQIVEGGMNELEVPEEIHNLVPLKKSGFAGKLVGKMKRTALLLKMLEDDDTSKPITADMVDRAIAIAWWYVDHAEFIHGDKFVNDNNALERQLLKAIKEHPETFGESKPFTYGALSKFATVGGFRNRAPSDQKALLKGALDTLKKWNAVSPSIEVNRSTGETKWIANEAIFECAGSVIS